MEYMYLCSVAGGAKSPERPGYGRVCGYVAAWLCGWPYGWPYGWPCGVVYGPEFQRTMILLADSGSTKCTWIADDGLRTQEIRTRGINAVQNSDAQIRGILDELPDFEALRAIRFYGAGCGTSFPEASQRLRRELERRFTVTDITIESDLTAAARALWEDGEGIACILGTGSNSCHCRNGEIIGQVPPLGYILGDEGSGSALGRALLNGLFKGHIPLREEFLAESRLTYEEIIRRVYCEPSANRFLASLAPFVRSRMECPEIREMVSQAFREFARRNLKRYPAGLTVACLGGIAAHFEQPLREALADEGFRVGTIVESPAQGLIRYHHGEANYGTEFGIR